MGEEQKGRIEKHDEALRAGAGRDLPDDIATMKAKRLAEELRGADRVAELPLIRTMLQRLIQRIQHVAEEVSELERYFRELAEEAKRG